jgi:hypothetical protein
MKNDTIEFKSIKSSQGLYTKDKLLQGVFSSNIIIKMTIKSNSFVQND